MQSNLDNPSLTIFIFAMLDWNLLGMEANAGEYR